MKILRSDSELKAMTTEQLLEAIQRCEDKILVLADHLDYLKAVVNSKEKKRSGGGGLPSLKM